ncbi:hypothetical protein O181_054658 [Austropuccinia psidii MF-1]|uniref:CAMK protein kinase n=1 Tax=Austropuccinia psidii MF-1 TaxID=1389203 RepID=A0A9Q3HRM6_9BASI|nr:hypothetical protein [Austropuccinia psidii MF-1]
MLQDINHSDSNHLDDPEISISQSTQDIQPTQINQDAPDLISNHSQSQSLPISNIQKPWAILHSLSPHVHSIKLFKDQNPFGIGRHKGPLPSNAPFNVNLVIGPNDGHHAGMISRFHALIQQKGLDDSDEIIKSNQNLSKPLIRGPTLPNNGENGKIVISLCDFSANGTFINGKRCTQKKWTKLNHGDEISLGSKPGKIDQASDVFVWLVSIPSQPTFPMNKLPSEQSPVCKEIYDRFDFLVALGKGAFATTWKAFDRNTGEYRAIKVIRKIDHSENPQNLINFRREIAILHKVDHPNIVKFYGSKEDEHLIWIILELVDGGEYLDYICNADGLDENSCRLITIMLLHAINYMAKLEIAHRDLKPENILMTSGKNPQAKIADFGLAKQLSDKNENFKTHCGTPAYVAPEVLSSRLSAGYTVAVDMFSLGVIVYASLGNCSPFDSQDQKGDIRVSIRNRKVDTLVLAKLKPNITQAALDFIKCLTRKEPRKRLTAAQALKHPWVTALDTSQSHQPNALPENPTKIVTHPRSSSSNLIIPKITHEPLHSDQPPRSVLLPSNLNIDAEKRKSVVSGNHASPSDQSLAPKTLIGDYQDRRDYYSSGTSPITTERQIDVESSGLADQEEFKCSQQLDDLHLETRQELSPIDTPIMTVKANSPSHLAPTEPDLILSEFTDKSFAKRKLRQWSTSPPHLSQSHSFPDKTRDAIHKNLNSTKETKGLGCTSIKPESNKEDNLKSVGKTSNRKSIRVHTKNSNAKKHCVGAQDELSISKSTRRNSDQVTKPIEDLDESFQAKRRKR